MNEYGENPIDKIKLLEKIIEENAIRESSRIANLELEKEELKKKLRTLRIEFAILQKNLEKRDKDTCQIC
uniref:Uncharacterized protein n=1 Tax=viral metagenome TaxID=1070528 RepID=A0A6C0FCH8_9ZZZZ|tara:strand:+ start:3709 stop:3918 length:210 start_codon:yes stop_codon:yes gene_type:complete